MDCIFPLVVYRLPFIQLFNMNKSTLSILILAIVYSVGIVGIKFNVFGDILSLTPLNLLFSLAVLLWNHDNWNRKFLIAIVLVALAGFFVEVAGVQTGVIFGTYTYGKTLGWKWLGVPLTMAVNWLILVYCAAAIVSKRDWSVPMKALVGAVMMTSMDAIIEPVAIRYDFWHWEGGAIPVQNYLAWGIISFLLFVLFHKLVPSINNKVAFALFLFQIIFFVCLLL